MATEQISVKEFGDRLREARLAQSRSLDDIATQTRIHRRHLEAIEAGEIGHLPEGPYAKAFIREYARSLGVPVPAEFGIPSGNPKPNAKDPKVVSRPVNQPEKPEAEEVLPIAAVAKETVRFANTAVNTAVRTVAKTTEKMVDFVESGSKEAIEVLTSKTLWDEAEEVRRERLGLAPKPTDTREPAVTEDNLITVIPEEARLNPKESDSSAVASHAVPLGMPGSRLSRSSEARVSSRGATNVIIALLVVLFAGAVVYAIKTYKRDAGSLASDRDYIPAPVEKPSLPNAQKRPVTPATTPTPTPLTAGTHDSLKFQIRARDVVWISIAPDGIPAYRGEMKAGEVRTFTAADRFIVNIGNQKSVALSLNGRSITNLPTIPNSGVVVRDLVLTRDRAELGGQSIDLNPAPTSPVPETSSNSTPPASLQNSASSPTAAGTSTPAKSSAATSRIVTSTASPKPKTPATTNSSGSKTASGTADTGGRTTRTTPKPAQKRHPPMLPIPPLDPIPARP